MLDFDSFWFDLDCVYIRVFYFIFMMVMVSSNVIVRMLMIRMSLVLFIIRELLV